VVSVIAAEEQPQFAYAGPANQITVDITSTGTITIKDIVKKAGLNSPIDIILHSKAFAGYSIDKVSATPPLEFTAWPNGPETIRFSVPGLWAVQAQAFGWPQGCVRLFLLMSPP
jgi:hypothetical protein